LFLRRIYSMDFRKKLRRYMGWWGLLTSCLAALLLSGCETFFHAPYISGGRLQPAGFFDTVIVDAGHGGHDSGARSVKGLREKDLALDTARRVATMLRGAGLRVIETRTSDYFVTLDKRVSISNRQRNAIFVSIHYNWARRSKARGIETFFYGGKSSRLAANIQKESLMAYRTENRGIKYRGFYVLKNNNRPSVLCELGFLSNYGENKIVQSSFTRQRLAKAIVDGILAEKAGRYP
jgi:N-acetylmuramoyl-L-alanine amidase